MRGKERHNGHPDRKPNKKWKAKPDLNTMRPGVVHNVMLRPNGSVVSFEGYAGSESREK
jgi:hypothetical protein